MLRMAQKKTKRSFALRLVGVLWTESRVCGSLLGFESAPSVTSPSCGVECVLDAARQVLERSPEELVTGQPFLDVEIAGTDDALLATAF